MLYFIRHGLGNWRQSCYVEVNERTGVAESGYWATNQAPLTEDELAFANDLYLDDWQKALKEYAAEAQWERDREK